VKQHRFLRQIKALETTRRTGALTRIMPTWLESDGPSVPLGTLCAIDRGHSVGDSDPVIAEVIRVDPSHIALAPFGEASQLVPGARVVAFTSEARLPAGDNFLGRAIDALGRDIEGGRPIIADTYVPIDAALPSPMERVTPNEKLETGLRSIDGLLTLGRGQRVGIFAASGVGKTTLISQLTRQVDAECTVMCLVGERGLEVEHFWSRGIDEATKRKTVLVAATSDKAAALRVRAVHQALAIACYWRAQGKHVLFVIDSVTRLAMAMREMGLAAGEPPTVRAYTPSVFAAIPKIVEQCGALARGGSITAIMTILSETDEIDDPISEMMRSLLDGHIVLSRGLAERGHFPAIDITRSVSRNATALMTGAHRDNARSIQAALADYDTSRTLIESGLYSAGSSEAIDLAIKLKPQIDHFLEQSETRFVPFTETISDLRNLVESHA
jgi:flagellum-specific ATP synthase